MRKQELKQEINEYLEIINNSIYPNDKDMQDYIKKQCSDVFKSKNGNYIEFEKQSIEKDFCFGYGQYGISSPEEEERAEKMADYAKNDFQYFIDRNLKPINEKIKSYKNARNLFVLPRYDGKEKKSRLCSR